MLSLSLNEAVRRGPWTCLSCATPAWTLQGWIASSSRPLAARTHQRKHSSSKPSSPPKDESRAITTPSESPSKEVKSPTKERTEHRSNTRLNRRKSKDIIQETSRSKDEARHNLPSVPSTQALKPQDIHLASFFSIHRPMSVTTSVPPASNSTLFSKIFTPALFQNPQPPEVLYTISSAVESLENSTSHHDPQQSQQTDFETADLHNAISQVSSSTNGDSQSRTLHINVEELAKHIRPFVPPPPPVAETPARKKSRKTATTKQKSYSTVLTIVESTHANGSKTYNTEMFLPLREDSNPVAHRDPSTRSEILPLLPRQPFLNHMRERQLRWEQFRERNRAGKARLAISVRRQRKLKMKKHKYKKLMRRTKFLRRKMDKT